MHHDLAHPARYNHDLHACAFEERWIVFARFDKAFAQDLWGEQRAAREVVEGWGGEGVEDLEGIVGIVFVGVVVVVIERWETLGGETVGSRGGGLGGWSVGRKWRGRGEVEGEREFDEESVEVCV